MKLRVRLDSKENTAAKSLNLSSPLMSAEMWSVKRDQATAFISSPRVFVTRGPTALAISGVKEFGLQTPFYQLRSPRVAAETFLRELFYLRVRAQEIPERHSAHSALKKLARNLLSHRPRILSFVCCFSCILLPQSRHVFNHRTPV